MDKEFQHWFNMAAAESEKEKGQKEEAGLLFPGFGGSVQALCHYMLGSRKPLEIDFIHIMPLFIRLTDFEKFREELEKYEGKNVKTSILVKDGYTVQPFDWLTFGSISVIIEGIFESDMRGWMFSGTLGPEKDLYDFDLEKSHRSKIGEFCTKQGSKLPGEKFEIRIKGSRRIQDSGRW